MRKAIVLLSGGLDSSVCLGLARRDGYQCYALAFDYGQRHRVELEAAARVAKHFNAQEFKVVQIDMRTFGGSALTADLDVPKDRTEWERFGIHVTYVPARNTIFLSFALAWAEVLDCSDIFIGVNKLDHAPDSQPDYIEAFRVVANLGTKVGLDYGFTLHTPLSKLNKTEIVRLGVSVGLDFALTHTCYDPEPVRSCGRCDSCLVRRQGFLEAGLPDPLVYAP